MNLRLLNSRGSAISMIYWRVSDRNGFKLVPLMDEASLPERMIFGLAKNGSARYPT
jgi:hypothetical protein